MPPDEPLTAIGLGSNLLVRDGGIRGTVVVLHAALNTMEMRDGLIYAEAGVASPKVARFAAKHGLSEAEFLAGIPGTVGGALAMNAGCYGGETWRYVARVEVLTRAGILEERSPSVVRDRLPLACAAPTAARATASSPRRGSRFREGDAQAPRACASRSSCAGGSPRSRSTCRMPAASFAIPPATMRRGSSRAAVSRATRSAERGCRRSTRISSSIRRARARAADIEAIIAHVRAVVRERTGVDLEPEVQVMGESAGLP